jgi:hypothetical protein
MSKMSFNYKVFIEHTFIYGWGNDFLEEKDLIDYQQSILTSEFLQPNMKELLDFRNVTDSNITSKSLAQFVQFENQNRDEFEGWMVAVLVESDLQYGLGRMFDSLLQIADTPSQTMIFRDFSQACTWLDIDPDFIISNVQELEE